MHVGRPGIIWADARSLDACALAEALLDAAGAVRAGIAAVPIAAEVAAVHGTQRIMAVPPGAERAFLAPWPVAVLDPPRDLLPALAGTGIECCADLARLDLEAVEVRFGAAGVSLWRLARADDRRLLFEAVPRALPHASLEWTDYTLQDPEQLLFIVNRLAGNVSSALHELGQGAAGFTLAFTLAGGGVVERPLQPSRVSADQRAWMRLIRDALERFELNDGIVGIALSVDTARPVECAQGDVLDRGFASAGAAAEALARVLDRDATAVTPQNSRHPLVRERTQWIQEEPSFVWARPQIGHGDTDPELALHLLPEPEPIDTETIDRQGFAVPIRYRERGGSYEIIAASGPDCLSGGQWDTAYAYEVYCCVRADGELVQLCRDARQGRWEMHGVWR